MTDQSVPTTDARPLDTPSSRTEWRRVVIVLACAAPALLLLIDFKPLAAMAYFGLLGMVALMSLPRLTFVLFFLSVGLFMPYLIGGVAINSFDILLAVLFLSTLLEFLLSGRTEIRGTGIDIAFLALITATILSGLFAHNPSYSVLPSVRIILIYLAFRMVFKYSLEIGVRRIALLYIGLVTLLAAVNLGLFLFRHGQDRIFGPAWLGFETYAMTALPMTLGFILWSRSTPERLKYILIASIIGFGLLASQSRAPLLAVIVSVPLLLWFTYLKSRKERSAASRRRVRAILVPIILLVAIVAIYRETLFMGALERFTSLIDSMSNPQETVLLRLVLGKAAIKGFLAHPILGVGIGNFKIIDQVVPEMRMEPVWFYIRGFSAHNVVLQYLAETGLAGTLSLLAMVGLAVRKGYRSFRRHNSDADQQVAAALFAAMLVLGVTLFYMRAWTWGQGGYIMAILLGLTTAWHYQLNKEDRPGEK